MFLPLNKLPVIAHQINNSIKVYKMYKKYLTNTVIND